MATWRRFALGAAAVVIGVPVVLCGGSGLAGLMLDPEVAIEVTETVDAPPREVFALLADADGLTTWWTVALAAYAAEHGGDADAMQVVPRGDLRAGPGAVVDFVAGGMTTETWEILAVEAPTRVTYDIDFKMFRVERTITLTPDGGGTRVHWAETGHMGNPWMRVMGATMGQDGVRDNFRGAIRALGQAAAS